MIVSSLLPAAAVAPSGIEVVNPATGEILGRVADLGADDVRSAIDAAEQSLAATYSALERSAWLRGISDSLLAERDEMARIITLENGKPLKEAKAEVDYAAGFFSYFAPSLDQIAPRPVPDLIHGNQWTIEYRPAGVAALITPWNFPLAMLAKKLAASLGAGCAAVVKPSELTPLSAIALAGIAARAGVPTERVHVVTGNPQPIGHQLCAHPSVRVISFTGSTKTGQLLQSQAAPFTKRLALELGGNAPFIVFDDADIDAAADGLIANKFRCGGQTCVCANRVYVHKQVYSEFVEAVRARVAILRVGDGMDPETDIGPLINLAARNKVARHVGDALSRGGSRIFGNNAARPASGWGCYYTPTILTGCNAQMLVFQEETFGPVIAVARFSGEDEVIQLANDTPYGLAGYLFTADKARAKRCAAALRLGHLGINTGAGPAPEAPFGGMKQSGFGREGGNEGLREYVEIQTIARAV